MDEWWPWWVVLVAAGATYAWRGLGVMLAGRLEPAGWFLEFVNCMAHALLAGLTVRMIVLPAGTLQGSPLTLRLAAAAVGLGVFFVTGRRILPGVIAGVATFIVSLLLIPGLTTGLH